MVVQLVCVLFTLVYERLAALVEVTAPGTFRELRVVTRKFFHSWEPACTFHALPRFALFFACRAMLSVCIPSSDKLATGLAVEFAMGASFVLSEFGLRGRYRSASFVKRACIALEFRTRV